MIKIKRKEFIKFLQNINEMRSSYSRSFIDNAGEEDFTPIDASQEVSSLQLTTMLPDVSDEKYVPSSNKSLRNALIRIGKEVPSSKIEDFYRNVLKVFEKTIDGMPEEENPFNPITESTIRTLLEMSNDGNDEVSGEPFNFDSVGPGIFIDLSNVQGSKPLISNLNTKMKSEDPEHVDTTVFEVIMCIDSPVFKSLFESDPVFKKEFAEEIDLSVIDNALTNVEKMDYLDPVEAIEEAIQNLMVSLSTAFLLAKLNVLEKVFGSSRSKQDVKVSSYTMSNPESINEILSYDKVIPDFLYEIAIASAYNTTTLSKQETLKLLIQGLNSIVNPSQRLKNIATTKYGNPHKKEIENGQLEIMLPKKADINLKQFDSFGHYDEDRKTYVVDPEIRKYLNYVQIAKGGERDDIINAACYLYYTIARASFYKHKKDNPQANKVARQAGEKKRMIIDTGNAFKGTLLVVDNNSNIVKELLRTAAENILKDYSEKETVIEFLDSMRSLISDKDGKVTPQSAIDLGMKIIKKSEMGSNVASLDIHESFIYSNCYYQLSDALSSVGLKMETSFQNAEKPVYDPQANPIVWPQIPSQEASIINSRLEGIDNEIVDFVFRYISHIISTGEEILNIVNRSSQEAGGKFTIDIPVITFAYVAPYILAKTWQQTLSNHWERYKPGQKQPVMIDEKEETNKLKKYLDDKDDQWGELSPFIGFKGASGAKQFFEQQVSHRFAFLERHFKGGQTESGKFHFEILENIYDRLTPFFVDALEKYIKSIQETKKDSSLSQEDINDYDELEELYTHYLDQANEINNIVGDFSVFDIEGMEDQDWLFDDEDEEVPTNVSAKFDALLKNTVPGRALRMLAHDLTIQQPTSTDSFTPEFMKHVENIGVTVIAKDANLSLGGAQSERERMRVASEVIKYFSGKLVYPDYKNTGKSAKELVSKGFTEEVFIETQKKIAKLIDKLFARAMQAPSSKKEISFTEFGSDVVAYVNKNISKGQMRKMVDDRLESISNAVENFTVPENMNRVINIVDNYILDAYDESELDALYTSYEELKKKTLEKYKDKIFQIKQIQNENERNKQLRELEMSIKREMKTEKDSIQKQALDISTGITKRRSDNKKMQGKLL